MHVEKLLFFVLKTPTVQPNKRKHVPFDTECKFKLQVVS